MLRLRAGCFVEDIRLPGWPTWLRRRTVGWESQAGQCQADGGQGGTAGSSSSSPPGVRTIVSRSGHVCVFADRRSIRCRLGTCLAVAHALPTSKQVVGSKPQATTIPQQRYDTVEATAVVFILD